LGTLAENILEEASGKSLTAGEIVYANVDTAMSHENAALVIRWFKEIGRERVWNNERIVIIFDHRVPAESIKTAEGQKKIRNFVKEQGIKYFYDINTGICHQVLAEKGFSRPGIVLVGTDSHTTTAGAFGAFATGIGATEMAGVWATGKIWFKVPETIKINVEGELNKGIYAKDVILNIIGHLGADGANYMAVEFDGEAIKKMSIASRMVLSNLSMEMGAKVAFVYPDEKTRKWLEEREAKPYKFVLPDKNARYVDEYNFNASEMQPVVACPHSVDNVKSIEEVEGVEIQQAFIGSCTNGRLEDLREAARILKGRKVRKSTRLIIGPASWEVYRDAMREGLLDIFIEAGGVIINPGCGPCLGAHQGILASGETAISTTNRNFQGRMGSPESFVYLASPATVAASAIEGKIADPRKYLR